MLDGETIQQLPRRFEDFCRVLGLIVDIVGFRREAIVIVEEARFRCPYEVGDRVLPGRRRNQDRFGFRIYFCHEAQVLDETSVT